MDQEKSVELALRDGEEYRSVSLCLKACGDIRLMAHDMGPSVEKAWGDDDYEFWVNIPKSALGVLAFALLQEKFSGKQNAVDDLRDFCEAHNVPHSFDSWV